MAERDSLEIDIFEQSSAQQKCMSRFVPSVCSTRLASETCSPAVAFDCRSFNIILMMFASNCSRKQNICPRESSAQLVGNRLRLTALTSPFAVIQRYNPVRNRHREPPVLDRSSFMCCINVDKCLIGKFAVHHR